MTQLINSAPASGTGSVTIAAPVTNSTRTITLPDATTTVVGTDTAQTLTNKIIQGGALTLATAQNSTSGTAIDFTGIPSWVKRITVMFDGVSLSGSDDFLIQLGDSGGLENSGYLSSTSVVGASTVATSNNTSGFLFTAGASTRLFGGAIFLINLSGNIWVCNGGIADSSTARTIIAYGSKTLSDKLTQVSVTRTGTNTFDAGSINIMYEG